MTRFIIYDLWDYDAHAKVGESPLRYNYLLVFYKSARGGLNLVISSSVFHFQLLSSPYPPSALQLLPSVLNSISTFYCLHLHLHSQTFTHNFLNKNVFIFLLELKIQVNFLN